MRKIVSQTLACLLPLLAPGAIGAAKEDPDIDIALHETVLTTSSEPVLGELVHIDGRDSALTERLRLLPAGGVLRGYTTVERAAIAKWLRSVAGLDTGRVRWSGAQAVRLAPPTRSLAARELAYVAQERLAQALAPLGGRQVLELVDANEKLTVPAGELEFLARALPVGTAPARQMFVWVDLMSKGRYLRSVPVRFHVFVFRQGWVAKQTIPAGTRLAADSFEVREVDLLAQAGDNWDLRGVGDAFRGAGDPLLAKQALRAGQPLTWRNSIVAPLVARGTRATLHMRQASFELESRVEVLQDGYLGQVVKVKGAGSTGPVTATVAGAGLVEVRL